MGDSFHVRSQAKPELISLVLKEVQTNHFGTLGELEEWVRAQGVGVGTIGEQVTRLRKLRLLSPSELQLTPRGRDCVMLMSKHPSIFYDVLHYYHYSLWHPRTPEVNRFSWTYSAICRHLWTRASTKMDNNTILERLWADVEEEFPSEPDVSLSTGSVSGVISWLKKLQPSVITNDYFERRLFVAPELVVLGVDSLYNLQEVDYGELVSLDDEALEMLASLCMVNVDILMDVLREADQQFSWFDMNAGWGYHVRLHCTPKVAEGL